MGGYAFGCTIRATPDGERMSELIPSLGCLSLFLRSAESKSSEAEADCANAEGVISSFTVSSVLPDFAQNAFASV